MGIEEEIRFPNTGDQYAEKMWNRASFGGKHAPDPIITAIASLQRFDDFWTEREGLTHIRDSARALMAPPWAVLGATLARLSCTIPSWVALPAIVGGKASVNIYAALAGPPSSGKTISLKAAQAAMKLPEGGEFPLASMEPWTVPLGTGEGVTAQYVAWKKEKGEEPYLEHIRRSVLFTVDEAEALEALKQRSGSTVGETLRRAWTGESLGFANRAQETRLLVKAGEYRLSLIAGVQPATAMTILSPKEFGTGLAQRFVWFDATDPKAPDETPEMPWRDIWKPPDIDLTAASSSFDVAPAIKSEIQAARRVSLRGESDPKEQHRNLNRLKIAAVLAWMDQRRNVAESDWRLAGVVMDHSDALRAKLIDEARRAKRKEEIGRVAGQISAHEEVMKRRVENRVKELLEHGPKVKRDLVQRVSAPQREYLSAVLEDLIAEGKVELRGAELWWQG